MICDLSIREACPNLPLDWMTSFMAEKKDAKFQQCPITGSVSVRRQSKDQEEGEGEESPFLFGIQNTTSQPVKPVTFQDTLPAPPHSLTIVHGAVQNKISVRVLARLSEAESREPDAWLRDDYRIAWLTVLHCADGISDPWRFAFWKYLGRTPEKLIPLFLERAEKHRLMNVPDYDPTLKKQPSPVRSEIKKERAK
jgi:hypothetical protein